MTPEEGTVVLLLDELPAETRDDVIEAGWACPTGAIMASEN
jgi:ferredoxin